MKHKRSILGALGRRILWLLSLGAYRIDRETDEMMANDPLAVRMAFDDAQENVKARWDALLEGSGKLRAQHEKDKIRLETLDKREDELEEAIAGALEAAEEIIDANPDSFAADSEYISIEQDVAAMSGELEGVQGEMESLQSQLEADKEELERLTRELRALEQKNADLEREEQRAVTDLVSASAREEIERNLSGMTSELDESALDVVRGKIAERKGRVEQLRETNRSGAKERESKYRRRQAGGKLDQLLKQKQAKAAEAKAAERADGVSTGSAEPKEKRPDAP